MFKYLTLPFLVVFSTSSFAKKADCITEKQQLQHIQKIMKTHITQRVNELKRSNTM